MQTFATLADNTGCSIKNIQASDLLECSVLYVFRDKHEEKTIAYEIYHLSSS